MIIKTKNRPQNIGKFKGLDFFNTMVSLPGNSFKTGHFMPLNANSYFIALYHGFLSNMLQNNNKAGQNKIKNQIKTQGKIKTQENNFCNFLKVFEGNPNLSMKEFLNDSRKLRKNSDFR